MNQSTLTSMPLNGFGQVAAAPSFLNLNVIIDNVLESQKERLQQLQAIFRCDALPAVRGVEKELKQLFLYLTSLILSHPPEKSKLFIYIRCERKKGETLPSDECCQHAISVYTNSTSDVLWDEPYKGILQQCGAICSNWGGTFVHQVLSTNSCLFTLNLPGKF